MQKFIRITAIVAAVLVALSFLLLLISIPLQRGISSQLFGTSEDILALMPIIPWHTIIYCFLLLGCGILMIVCAGNKKGGIWLEILLLAAVALALPITDALLGYAQNLLIGRFYGNLYLAAYSSVKVLSSYCMWPANLGHSLVLVVCGMSIAFKRMSKKLAKAAE